MESETPAIKFLGILIDPQLSFKFHINSISGKLAIFLFFLKSSKKHFTPTALKSVYYALFHSHFIYCIHIWSSTTLSNLNGLFVKQKMAVRILNSAKYNTRLEPLFKQPNILPLPCLVEYFKLQFSHNFILNELPRSFTNT